MVKKGPKCDPGAYILQNSKNSSSEPKKHKFNVNPVEIFSKIDVKLTFDLNLALFERKRAWKYGPWGSYFIHPWKHPRYACKPSFMVTQ